MRWQVKFCPRCHSRKILYEVDGRIQFRIADDGHVQIDSTPDDLVEVVEVELNENGATGYCEKCGLTFKA